MADDITEDNKAPQNGQAEKEQIQDSSTQQDEQSPEKDAESTFQIPDKFKGKSAEDIAKSYIQLEKKLGEKPRVDEMTQKELAQWRQLGSLIEKNPALYKTIEDEIKKSRGESVDESESDSGKQDDLRLATQSRIIGDFEKEYGMSSLSPEKRAELSEKIALEVAEMYDPEGKKSVKEVFQAIPLIKLDKALQKAYKLATLNDHDEQVRMEAIAQARENNEASFGNISSSSVNESKIKLTEDERKVARKMGISEQDYLKQKEIIETQ